MRLLSSVTQGSLEPNFGVAEATVLKASQGGASLILLPGSSDHCYLSFYPRTASPGTRGGYFGFGSTGSTNLNIANEAAGNLVLQSQSTGNISMVVGGFTRFTFDATALLGGADNARDIGAPTNRLANGYFGTYLGLGINANFDLPGGSGVGYFPQFRNSQTAGVSGVAVGVMDGTNNRRVGLFCDQSNGIVGLSYTHTSGPTEFSIRGPSSEFLRIDSVGNVGVAGAPTSGKLYVNGAINAASGFRVNGSAASGTFLKGNGTNYVSGSITAADLPAIAAGSILGNNSGSSAAPSALTATQARSLLSINNVENTALSTWSGSSNITTVGTITHSGGVDLSSASCSGVFRARESNGATSEDPGTIATHYGFRAQFNTGYGVSMEAWYGTTPTAGLLIWNAGAAIRWIDRSYASSVTNLTGSLSISDSLNVTSGITVAGAAAANAFLVGNGTKFVSASLTPSHVTTALGFTPPPNTRSISTGSGLTGGGNLSADRTISIATGGVSSTMLADGSVTANKIGATIPVSKGGTGTTSFGLTGELVYVSSSTQLSSLSMSGSNGKFLKSNGSTPSWNSIGYSDLTGNATMIDFGASGVNPPSMSGSRSAGTKLLLYAQFSSGSSADYAIGIESSNVWFSTATTSGGFKFYGGTTLYASLNSGGLTLSVPLLSVSSTAQVTNLNAQYLGGQGSSFYTNASNLSSGTVPAARLGLGTANSTTFLRGDGTWAVPSGGGGGGGGTTWSDSTTGSQTKDIISGLARSGYSYKIIVWGHDSTGSDYFAGDYTFYVPNSGSLMRTAATEMIGPGFHGFVSISHSGGVLTASVTGTAGSISWKAVIYEWNI